MAAWRQANFVRNQVNLIYPCADPEGGAAGLDPPENHKDKGFLSSTETPSQRSMLRHHQPASETHLMAFRWRTDNGPLLMAL